MNVKFGDGETQSFLPSFMLSVILFQIRTLTPTQKFLLISPTFQFPSLSITESRAVGAILIVFLSCYLSLRKLQSPSSPLFSHPLNKNHRPGILIIIKKINKNVDAAPRDSDVCVLCELGKYIHTSIHIFLESCLDNFDHEPVLGTTGLYQIICEDFYRLVNIKPILR